jgi:hypothetical protein
MNSLSKMEPGRLADVSNVKQINLNGDETLRELSLGREDDGEEPDEANEYSQRVLLLPQNLSITTASGRCYLDATLRR